jgi:peptidoglycan/xylan/chitin deacetylase (PgdA/CDA1 family)
MNRAAILAYHSIDDGGSVLSVSPRVFAEHLRMLQNTPARVVALEDIKRGLRDDAGRGNLVAITFDDGFRSVYEHAFPLLRRYGFPATIFLVTDYCGKTNSWPSQPAWAPRAPLLDWTEIREMAAHGIAFGSHTRTHPDLRRLSVHEVDAELAGSKHVIENAIGYAVEALAYPYGTYDPTVKQLTRAHYPWACTTDLGFVRRDTDPLALTRLDAYYLRKPALFGRLFSPDVGVYLTARRWLRDMRRGVLFS